MEQNIIDYLVEGLDLNAGSFLYHINRGYVIWHILFFFCCVHLKPLRGNYIIIDRRTFIV